MKDGEERKYDIELTKCIHPECKGELVELMYGETYNWITGVYKCAKCGREFTMKLEL